jgi:hypothetical protein
MFLILMKMNNYIKYFLFYIILIKNIVEKWGGARGRRRMPINEV